jgi:O-antigen/teichoic acid export membrane protein
MGVYSLVISSILIFSFFSQIITSNQGIQFKLMSLDSEGKNKMLFTLCSLMIFSVLLIFIILIFFPNLFHLGTINLKYSIFSIFGACIVLVLVSVFDLHAIIHNKLNILYLSGAVNAVCGVFATTFILYSESKENIIFIPLLGSLGSLFLYLFVNIRHLPDRNTLLPNKNSFREVFDLLKESWIISTIPVCSNVIDYFLRLTISRIAGFSVLGIFQTVTSIEGLTGNVLLGPLNRKILFSHMNVNYKYTISSIIKKSFLLSLIPIMGFILVIISDHFFRFISNKYYNIINVVVFVLIFRIIWNIWGSVGQVLISLNKFKLVSFVEIGNKFLVSLLFIIFLFYFNCGIWAYLYALIVVSIMMLFIQYIVTREYLVHD